MAVHRIPILGFATLPDTSGNVYPEPFDVKATNDLYKNLVWVFADTATKIGLHGRFKVPKNYVGLPKIVLEWTSTAITGNVVWDFDYTAVGGDSTESLDPAAHQESVTATVAAPTTALFKRTVVLALTAANLAVDDEVQFVLSRDGADAADTMAAAALLVSASFEYSDA
jgi:putative transposon-encoded protein